MILACEPLRCNLPRRSDPAWCEWHRRFLRTALPENCPAATPDPIETLAAMQHVGWSGMPGDFALTVLDQADVCGRCLERGLSHPTIVHLRRKAGLAE